MCSIYMGPSSWLQEGAGSVYSMPTAMMAGMYAQCSAVCKMWARRRKLGWVGDDGAALGGQCTAYMQPATAFQTRPHVCAASPARASSHLGIGLHGPQCLNYLVVDLLQGGGQGWQVHSDGRERCRVLRLSSQGFR